MYILRNINFRLVQKYLILFSILVISDSTVVFSDTRVDGFFSDNMVRSGMFENDRHIKELHQEKSNKDSFFISREERRRNPEKAVSNSILPVPPSIRSSRYPLLSYPFMPGAWIPGVHYSPSELRQHRINKSQTQSSQTPVQSNILNNNPQNIQQNIPKANIQATILEEGDSFDLRERMNSSDSEDRDLSIEY